MDLCQRTSRAVVNEKTKRGRVHKIFYIRVHRSAQSWESRENLKHTQRCWHGFLGGRVAKVKEGKAKGREKPVKPRQATLPEKTAGVGRCEVPQGLTHLPILPTLELSPLSLSPFLLSLSSPFPSFLPRGKMSWSCVERREEICMWQRNLVMWQDLSREEMYDMSGNLRVSEQEGPLRKLNAEIEKALSCWRSSKTIKRNLCYTEAAETPDSVRVPICDVQVQTCVGAQAHLWPWQLLSQCSHLHIFLWGYWGLANTSGCK